MVFSDPLFIFGFLPTFLVLYAIITPAFKNPFIFLASLGFYYYGEPDYVWVLLLSILTNYGFGVIIDALARGPTGKNPKPSALTIPALTLGVLFNLGVLLYFKYVDFFIANVDALLKAFDSASHIDLLKQVLPLGVSFFTFQGISYLVDVYRGDVRATRSLLKFGTYKILFPQLIAGPIVRYAEVSGDMGPRSVNSKLAMEGLRRFAVGFTKKVLIADTLAACADSIFATDPSTLSSGSAWFGAVTYSLQIYFDFSAYSDMAIGLGLIMGFHYPENFNHPYVSRSIREFWRRWHMTLSRWFRDYVYLPMGGNRSGEIRTYANLFAVFVLTGFWHGASWTFMAWGVWHGLFMILERRLPPEEWRAPMILRHVYALLVVLFGWVLFRADNFEIAWGMIQRMLLLGQTSAEHVLGEFASPVAGITLVVGLILSTPIHAAIRERLSERGALALGVPVLGALFVISCMKVLSGAYSPFLYFRF